MLHCTSQILQGQPCNWKPKLLFTTICDYNKNLELSLVLNILLNWLSSETSVSLKLLVCENIHTLPFWELLIVLTKDIYIKICIIRCSLHIYLWGTLVRNVLWKYYIVFNEKSYVTSMNVLQDFKLSRLNWSATQICKHTHTLYIYIYIGIAHT
jgi:hypothetical protein